MLKTRYRPFESNLFLIELLGKSRVGEGPDPPYLLQPKVPAWSWGFNSAEFLSIILGKVEESPGKAPGKSRKFQGKINFWDTWVSKNHSAKWFRPFPGRETMRNRLISSKMKNCIDKFSKKSFKNFLDRFWWKIYDFLSFSGHGLNFPQLFRDFSAEKWGRTIWKMGAPRPHLFRTPKNSTVA